MVLRAGDAAPPHPRPSVVGGENATHKADDGQAMQSVIAQAIEVPPEIPARLDRRIEAEPGAR